WTLNDYPSSLKNLPKPTKKKAIDIANALVDDGYSESRAIPIATSQAESWAEKTSEKDQEKYVKQGRPTEHDSPYRSRPELLDDDELVKPYDDNQWAVQSKKAQKPTKLFDTKEAAVDYGRQVAKNKQTRLMIQKQDGAIEKNYDYHENS